MWVIIVLMRYFNKLMFQQRHRDPISNQILAWLVRRNALRQVSKVSENRLDDSWAYTPFRKTLHKQGFFEESHAGFHVFPRAEGVWEEAFPSIWGAWKRFHLDHLKCLMHSLQLDRYLIKIVVVTLRSSKREGATDLWVGEVKGRATELREQVCTVDTMDTLPRGWEWVTQNVGSDCSCTTLWSWTTQPLKELTPLRGYTKCWLAWSVNFMSKVVYETGSSPGIGSRVRYLPKVLA